jgi:protein SCO1/2
VRTLVTLAACAALGASSARAAPPGSPWGAGYFPDVPLVTQEGKTVRFYADLVRDRFVVVNFVFTRCTKSCPLETANLARVQKLLGDRVGRDVFMYSISLDPEHDTPEVLAEYARKFHAGPGWLFLTGRRADVDLVRAKLGDRTKIANHAVSLWLGNDAVGQWTALSAVDDPGFLAASIDEWMRTDMGRHAPVRSYADAPPIRTERGEDLFRTRCAACHTVGRGPLVGPDLAGVTERRDRAWLRRWLADPGKLLDEKDPDAAELVARHEGIAMPRLVLREEQVADLVAYIEAHSGSGRPQP